MGNVKGQTKVDMIHSPITNIPSYKERIPHPSSTTSDKTILVKNLSCLNVMVYGTKKSCQTFTGTSEAKAATRGPANMFSKPMSPMVVASSSSSSSSSSCINTECEILGVLRSPAFLVGSSRSLRNKYGIHGNPVAAASAQRPNAASSTSSSSTSSNEKGATRKRERSPVESPREKLQRLCNDSSRIANQILMHDV